MAARLLWPLAVALSSLGAGAVPPAYDGGQQSWRLPHHSFDRTMTYADTLDSWSFGGATIALRDRVQFLPPIKHRHGHLWSKSAIETSDFEVRLSFSAEMSMATEALDQDCKLVIWLEKRNISALDQVRRFVSERSADWGVGLKANGYSLWGNLPGFSGLAVVLQGPTTAGSRVPQVQVHFSKDGTGSFEGLPPRPLAWVTGGTQIKIRARPDGSISGHVMMLRLQSHLPGSLWGWAADGLHSQGTMTFHTNDQVGWESGSESGWRDSGTWAVKTGGRIELRIFNMTYILRFEGSHRAVVEEPRMNPTPALLYGSVMAPQPEEDWTHIFELSGGQVPRGPGEKLYLGFTGMTGTESHVAVEFHRLSTRNFDSSVVGEDDSDVLAGLSAGEEGELSWVRMLEHDRHFLDQASQTEAISLLNALVQDDLRRQEEEHDKLVNAVGDMSQRMSRLEQELHRYATYTQVLFRDEKVFDISRMNFHIASIRDVLTRGRETTVEKLVGAAQNAEQLKLQRRSAVGFSGNEALKLRLATEQAASLGAASRLALPFGSIQLLTCTVIVVVIVLFVRKMHFYLKNYYV